MDFLSFGGGSNAASRVKSAVHHLSQAVMEAERRDAVEGLRKLTSKDFPDMDRGEVKKAVGTMFPDLFDLLRREELEEEVVETVLEVVNEACIAEDETPDMQGKTDGPGTLSGTGGVNFDWLSAPLNNTDAILKNPQYFETLVELLVPKRQWTRLTAIDLLENLLKNRRAETEKAIEATPAGMERLVDVLDDEHEAVRNNMLRLLRVLTENNEQLQNFVAFREGFQKLFQIITNLQQDESGEMIIQDCLTVMNNVLRGNPLTQKLFVQSNHLSHLPMILELPRADQSTGNQDGKGAAPLQSPKSVGEVEMTCSPPKMESLMQGIRLISYLVSGLCPKELLDQPWFDPEDEFISLSSNPDQIFQDVLSNRPNEQNDPDAKAELIRRHKAQLVQMQEMVGANLPLIQSLAELALCLPYDGLNGSSPYESFEDEDDEFITTWGDLRQQTFYILGDLVVGNPQIASQLLHVEVAAPRNSILSAATVDVLRLHRFASGAKTNQSDEDHASIRTTLVSGALQIALYGYSPDEKAAATYFCECLLHNNPTVQVSLVGHAITPPPMDLSDELFSSKVAPPPGRLLFNTLLSAASYGLRLTTSTNESDDHRKSPLDEEDDDYGMLWVEDILLRSARLFESLVKDNVTCKELALRIPVNSVDAGFRRPKSINAMLARQQSDEENCDMLFASFMKTYCQAVKSFYHPNDNEKSVCLLKAMCVSFSRCLVEWLNATPVVVSEFLALPSSLFLFEVASGNSASTDLGKLRKDLDMEGFSSLCLGLCLMYPPSSNDKNKKKKKTVTDPIQPVMQLVSSKIGFEVFIDHIMSMQKIPELKLAGLSKRAREQKRLKSKHVFTQGDDVQTIVPWYDKRFYVLYQLLRDEIQQAIIKLYTTGLESKDMADDLDMFDIDMLKEKVRSLSMVGEQYKEVIRMQDKEIGELKRGGAKVGNGSPAENAVDPSVLADLQREKDNLIQEKHDLAVERDQLLKEKDILITTNQQLQNQLKQLQQRSGNSDELVSANEVLTNQVAQLQQELFQLQQQMNYQPPQQYYDQQQNYDEQQQPDYENQPQQYFDNSQQSQGYYDQQYYDNNQTQTQTQAQGYFDEQPQQQQNGYFENVQSNGNAVDVLQEIMDALRNVPKKDLIKVLPDLADCISPNHKDDRFLKWLEEGAELASAMAEYDSAVRLVRHAKLLAGDEGYLSEKEDLYERQKKDASGFTTSETNSDDLQSLRDEHTQVLLLLANQEIEKQLLYDKVRELGGEQEENIVRLQSYKILERSFARPIENNK